MGEKSNRREQLLSAKTRATPQELNDKRNSVLSQSLACVNLKTASRKLAHPSVAQKKERIFSAVTANTHKNKTFATFDPATEAREEGVAGLQTMEPWIGVTDNNFAMQGILPKSKRIRFSGFKMGRARRLNRVSTQKNTSSPGSPRRDSTRHPPLAFPSGHHIITASLDSHPVRNDLKSPQNPAQSFSSALIQNSQLIEMI